MLLYERDSCSMLLFATLKACGQVGMAGNLHMDAQVLECMDSIAYSTRLSWYVGIADGLQLHGSSLPADVWQHAVSVLLHMLSKNSKEAEELQLVATASIGRLLLYAPESCGGQGQTEWVLAALVQTYIQPTAEPGSPLVVCRLCSTFNPVHCTGPWHKRKTATISQTVSQKVFAWYAHLVCHQCLVCTSSRMPSAHNQVDWATSLCCSSHFQFLKLCLGI